MTNFPKKVYLTRTVDDVGDTEEWFVDVLLSDVAEEDEGTEVAVYTLVKVGHVKKSSKVVFE